MDLFYFLSQKWQCLWNLWPHESQSCLQIQYEIILTMIYDCFDFSSLQCNYAILKNHRKNIVMYALTLIFKPWVENISCFYLSIKYYSRQWLVLLLDKWHQSYELLHYEQYDFSMSGYCSPKPRKWSKVEEI